MIAEKRRQYAQAIYELAKENNLVNDYLDISLAIVDVFNFEPKLKKYLSSQSVNHIEKKELISEILNDSDEFYKNWLFILIDNGKSKHIREYIEEYIKLYNKDNNVTKGIAWTVTPIEQKTLEKIQEKVSKKLDKKVMIENKIDKEIIGGIKLQVEDDIWDNSIKNKLIQLLKEGSDDNE